MSGEVEIKQRAYTFLIYQGHPKCPRAGEWSCRAVYPSAWREKAS